MNYTFVAHEYLGVDYGRYSFLKGMNGNYSIFVNNSMGIENESYNNC
jgi:hypothetical protein